MPVEIQLEHHQIFALSEALLSAYPKRNKLEQMLLLNTAKKLDHLTSDSANLTVAVFEIIITAQAEGWVGDLIKGAHESNPRNPELRTFVAMNFSDLLIALAGDSDPEKDPLDVHFLSEDRRLVFINRRQLRSGLRELTGPGITPRILAVHSELDQSGKTYTSDFIRFIALHREDQVAYVDLRDEISLGNGMQELVENLGRKLRADLDDIPKQEAQTARWIRKLVVWLLDQVHRSGQFWWFVFDSINQVDGLPLEIHDFIERLALQLVKVEQDPPCRLILLSYRGKEQLPVEIRFRVVEDEIRQKVGPDQMREFFKEEVRQLLGEDAENEMVQATADALCEVVRSELDALPEESRPYAISSIVREALVELEASVFEEEPV